MNQGRAVRMLTLELANWMTATEAAQYAGTALSSVRRALVAQELPAVKTYDEGSGGWLISRSDVELWAYHREGLGPFQPVPSPAGSLNRAVLAF